MSHQRVVNFALVFSAGLLSYVFYSLIDLLWVANEGPGQIFAGGITIPMILGVVVGVGVAAALRAVERVNTFLVEAVREIREIVWPTRQEVMDSTKVVIIATLFLAVVLWGFDSVWAMFAKAVLQ